MTELTKGKFDEFAGFYRLDAKKKAGLTRLFFGIQAVFEKRAYRTRFFFNQAVFKFGPTCFGTSSIINSTVVEQNFFRGNPKPGKLHIKLHCEKAILSFVVGLITERQLWYSNEC